MLKWVDTLDIAIELSEKYPEIDPQWINFVDLRNLVMKLDDFDDIPEKVNERILESIQQNWIEERD
ncbi:MAG: Fe-S assembly protein IscX [Gammaproteobacteria bacterium]|nr:Fe-S assembly protein IscX [Gammaproteobacteria bacterium]|tara:strand:+ start:3915 stop:4112 length:198 start_codon:yes stop_codon:yes gene_type:complete